MDNIDQHIQKDEDLLSDPTISPQSRRHTEEEWNELVALKDAISYAPQTVSAEKMEKFAELMVRTLEGKCDPPPPKNWRGSSLSE